jgi:hypothetical protein
VRFRIIRPTDLAWAAFIVAGVVLIFAMSLLIGVVIATLPFVSGLFVAFVLVVLVAALLMPELRNLWGKLPR